MPDQCLLRVGVGRGMYYKWAEGNLSVMER